MANKSNWKGTESKAAALFPGGKRRQRVAWMGGDRFLIADDIVWGPEHVVSTKATSEKGRAYTQRRVAKLPLVDALGNTHSPVYIDAKKKTKTFLHTEYVRIAEKYIKEDGARLCIVRQKINDRLILVTVDGDFFKELLEAWIDKNQIDI